MARLPSPIVAQARRKVLNIIRNLVEELREQALDTDDPYAHQDLLALADLIERVVFDLDR